MMDDTPERRTTIRESNAKLDAAVDHLSDVLDHLKFRDNSNEVNVQLNAVRNHILITTIIVWCAIVTLFVLGFIHARDQNKVDVEVQIMQLKLVDLQKEISSYKEHEENEINPPR